MAEHPFGGSWGYQVTSYYAPTSRFGTPTTSGTWSTALHQAGIGVHRRLGARPLPQGRVGAGPLRRHRRSTSTPTRVAASNSTGAPTFSTSAAREVRNFLVANALYWLQEFHIDGLRVDAVASMLYLDYSRPDGGWTPNVYGGRENLEAVQFLQEMNATVHKIAPGIVTIAEESTSWPGVTRPTNLGGLGFSMKWNMGWMNDTLDYISRDPIHRSYHHHEMTFSMLYAFSENYVLPISHDEVVHGKGTLWGRMPGNDHVKAAGLRGLLAYQWAHPGKQLLFMGQEFGQRAEWSEERGVDWYQLDEHSFSTGIQRMVRDINAIYRRPSGAVEPGHQTRGLLVDRRQRLGQQRAELPALRQRRLGDGVRVQLLRRRARPVPARAAARRPVARGAQHRRRPPTTARASAIWAAVERHRRAVARPPGIGGDGAATAGGAVARARLTTPAPSRAGETPRISPFAAFALRGRSVERVGEVAPTGDDVGVGGVEQSNSSISRVRTVVRSSPAVRLHQRDQAVERGRDVLLRISTSAAANAARCRRARRRPRDGIGPVRGGPLRGRRSDGPHPWPRRDWGWRRGSPDTRLSAASKSPASRCVARLRQLGVDLPRPPRPRPRRRACPRWRSSSESTQRRNCSGGCMPWKLDSGWPAASATTVGHGLHAEHLRDPRRGVDVDRRQRPLAAVGWRPGRPGRRPVGRWRRCAATTAAPRRAPGWTGPAPRLRSWPR